MAILEHLEPKSVFTHFEQLCAIPHGSRNTAAISDYLADFARQRGLDHVQDAAGNVVIFGPASPGYENAEPVILQGHMDMVCEKDPGCDLDMAAEGLRLRAEGDLVWAEGTTLGGDDGIAVAMMLALLDDKSLPHPPLECVFTVDEEIGMLGAEALDCSVLRGRRMLNVDSEVEGILTVSCAGGRRVNAVLPVRRAPFSGAVLRLTVGGLTGGHSGAEIHKGRANADMLLGRLLCAVAGATETRVVSVSGGGKDNAIPAAAEAVVVVEDAGAAQYAVRVMEAAFREEYPKSEPGLRLGCERGRADQAPLDAESTKRLLTMLACLPNGVQAMSQDIEGLVLTSLNLGILETFPDHAAARFAVRSALESGKEMLTERIALLMEALGGSIDTEGDYPGWAYRRESPLRELLIEVFTEQYGRAPVVDAIHAGLECGLFSAKLPGLDCVSIGPDLEDIHTPRERMHVASVRRTWALVCETLRRMK